MSDNIEHIFRHEVGPLVASLSRRMGAHNLDAIEDAVQVAMMKACELWPLQGRPDNASAWLYTVAYRQLISELRAKERKIQLLRDEQPFTDLDEASDPPDIPLKNEMNDAMLRMLFVACSDELPCESQLVFTLKSLCGFSVNEIAVRLFISQDSVYKRFGRARQYFKRNGQSIKHCEGVEIKKRIKSVHRVIYTTFTEGYLSSHPDLAIRLDLCHEAARLARLLSNWGPGQVPDTYALIALICLHSARMSTRTDSAGDLQLLQQQNRQRWDKGLIEEGLRYLAQAAQGEQISRYHIEAGIAAEHCMAPSFEETRWNKIVEAYELLDKIAPSPMHRLSHAVALAEWKGPAVALAALESLRMPTWLERSYQWYAVMADLQGRCGEHVLAKASANLAVEAAPTEEIKNLIRRRRDKINAESLP